MRKQDPIAKGLTLIELLIAVVLVLALGALVLPSLLNSLDERAFESSADVTNEQLVMARAHAQSTGSPVEVTYRPGTSQVQVRLFSSLVPNFAPGGISGDPSHGFGRNLPAFDATDDGAPRPESSLIGESWACQSLPHGVRFASRPPAGAAKNSATASTFGLMDDKPETIGDLDRGQDIRLAVFMPDGSALIGDPVWLNDESGRCGVFSINPWNGQPVFERVNVDRAEDSAMAAEDENALVPTSGSKAGDGSRNAKTGKDRPASGTPARKSKPRQPASTEDVDFPTGSGG